MAKQNKPEDTKPWEIINIKDPNHPQCSMILTPEITSPMCPTEEYATSDLISTCRMQIILVIKAPHIETLIKTPDTEKNWYGIIYPTRNNPYPPSFNNTPAKIIDPETGAST